MAHINLARAIRKADARAEHDPEDGPYYVIHDPDAEDVAGRRAGYVVCTLYDLATCYQDVTDEDIVYAAG